MASTGRLLRASRPLRLGADSNSPTTNGLLSLKYLSKAEMAGEKGVSWNGERKSKMVTKTSVAISQPVVISTEQQAKSRIDLVSLVAHVANATLQVSTYAVKRIPRKQQIQMMIEKGIIDSRFFSLLAVGGSLLGSVLCFVEGCFFILESYFEYFQAIAQRTDHGHVMKLLIEALDMFLFGCALLTFGTGLYALFVSSKNMKKENLILLPRSNLFGLFRLEKFPPCVGIQSVSQAKSKIGHSVVMTLQVGFLEKFKNVPLNTGLDLACFAGALVVLSACIFLLSKLTTDGSELANKTSEVYA